MSARLPTPAACHQITSFHHTSTATHVIFNSPWNSGRKQFLRFGESRSLFLSFQELYLTKITIYVGKKCCGCEWSVRTTLTFLTLIGSMGSLRHIEWIESKHRPSGSRKVAQYQERFHHNFQPGSQECALLFIFGVAAKRMRCTPTDEKTKTAVVSARGL